MANRKRLSKAEFEAQFGTEELCRQYLYNVRWPDGFVCPKCGRHLGYTLSNGYIQCVGCRHQTNITAGTFMHKSHISLTKWFWAIYMLSYSNDTVTSRRVQETLHVTYKTAWYMLSRIRASREYGSTRALSGQIEINGMLFNVIAPQPAMRAKRSTKPVKHAG